MVTSTTVSHGAIFPHRSSIYNVSVSAVDGYNLPMVIEPIGGKGGGCETASCGAETDLLAHCDPRLIFPPGSANIC